MSDKEIIERVAKKMARDRAGQERRRRFERLNDRLRWYRKGCPKKWDGLCARTTPEQDISDMLYDQENLDEEVQDLRTENGRLIEEVKELYETKQTYKTQLAEMREKIETMRVSGDVAAALEEMFPVDED